MLVDVGEEIWVQNQLRAHTSFSKRGLATHIFAPKGFEGDTQLVEPKVFKTYEFQKEINKGNLKQVDNPATKVKLAKSFDKEKSSTKEEGSTKEKSSTTKRISTKGKNSTKEESSTKIESIMIDEQNKSEALPVESNPGRVVREVTLPSAEAETLEDELKKDLAKSH